MPRGGARNRSGPAPKDDSGRSERRGYTLTALPAEGFDGPIPEWPLPRHADEDRVSDAVPDDAFARLEDLDSREAELWTWAWRTPQACAWSMPSEGWRIQTIARWVRQAAWCESPSAKAADHGQLHRYADQIGLTTAGLREMGWKVAVDEVADKAAARAATGTDGAARPRRLRTAPAPTPAPRARRGATKSTTKPAPRKSDPRAPRAASDDDDQ